MRLNQSLIVFVDNTINQIFKTVEALKQSFQNVMVFNQERDFFIYLETNTPDVILLNLDLQPNDALILHREIRNRFPESGPYVVIYSDKCEDFVQELAFNSGVDSFINFHNKISVLELFLKNMLRRKTLVAEVRKKELMLDSETFLIYKNGNSFQLPRKEFKILELLYNHPNKFLSKTEIAERIWNDESIAHKRIIDVHIYNIRQFLGRRIIQSQRGRGYRITRNVNE